MIEGFLAGCEKAGCASNQCFTHGEKNAQKLLGHDEHWNSQLFTSWYNAEIDN